MGDIYDRFRASWESNMETRNAPASDRLETEPFSWQLGLPPPRYTALNEEPIVSDQHWFGGEGFSLPAESDTRTTIPPSSWATTRSGSGEEFRRQHTVYSHQSSTSAIGDLTLRMMPTERSFLEWYPRGNATLTFQDDEKNLQSIRNLNLDMIAERSAVLAMAFEDSRSGPRLFLESLTSATAFPFLRFLYSGTYALTGPHGDFFEDVPTSVLLHCQLYHLGVVHDVEELKTQAYVNVIRQCEFGCCSPEKPIDLCAAIRYTYQHLPTHKKLINTILDYCVSCFLRHRLGQDAEFKALAYELRPFHQALCMNSRERDFENDAATAIIQLPFKPYVPDTYASREDVFAQRFDDVFHFHDDIDSPSKKRKRPEFNLSATSGGRDLPLRLYQDRRNHIKRTFGEEVEFGVEDKHHASSIADLHAFSEAASIVRSGAEHCVPLRTETFRAKSDESDSGEELPKVQPQEAPKDMEDASVSDSDFEVVQGPPAVEEISDSDSDFIDVVRIDHKSSETRANRSTNFASSTVDTILAGSDSDEEWQML